MEVAVPEEPQKKIFRARKTMKASDRQQLEVLHNTLMTTSYPSSSSPIQIPLVNGIHGEDTEKTTSPSPSKNGPEKTKDMKGENESKEDEKNEDVKLDNKEACKSEHSSSSTPTKKEDSKNSEEEKTSDCDPEVKEGFLCLSEEDDVQAEKDEKNDQSEKMEVDAVKETSEKTDKSLSTGTKRSLSEEKEEDDKENKKERDEKRARLDGDELEAQLELKITATGGSRHKLEKMVQQLVEERLRVLQLTVFDRSIKELKDRMEKIDSANKQQNAMQHLNTLQAKVSRLTKKIGAANQASENAKRNQETLENRSQTRSASETQTKKAMVLKKVDVVLNSSVSSPAHETQTVVEDPKPVEHSENSALKEELKRFKALYATETDFLRKELVSHKQLYENVIAHKKPIETHATVPEQLCEAQTAASAASPSFTGATPNSNPFPLPTGVNPTVIPGMTHPDLDFTSPTPDHLNMLMQTCHGRPDRYGCLLFRAVVPDRVYEKWASKTNWDGSRGKLALPVNLRQFIMNTVLEKFPQLSRADIKRVKDRTNEFLRTPRRFIGRRFLC